MCLFLYSNALCSSLPKFRKGILAIVFCQKLDTIQFDTPSKTRKKLEKQRTLEFEQQKSSRKPRVRFETYTTESLVEVDPELASIMKKKTKHNHGDTKSSTKSENQLVFDVGTIIFMKFESENWTKLIRLNTNQNTNFKIGLFRRHNFENYRRSSL